ncbi:vanadium-dependent haloperoxidase, partial [Candidatus Synechococcus spongiarum]|uniref:vanadium-dependent haloperoxidase n=1 Tax=Candidatus Synechococcus spongiarum TaxID=431041 RepID=UPI001F342F58
KERCFHLSRRKFLLATAGTSVATVITGCPAPHVAPFGHRSSYGTQIIKPQYWNTVFQSVDAALQQVRDQRVLTPQAAYNYSIATTAGFLAANGIVQAYGEPFGIGAGPREANPEVAYGIAFAEAAAEAFQQPFLFERIAFLNQFPNNEAKSLGVQWGKTVGRKICEIRTNDGSEPSEVNYYLGRYRRRTDSLRWRPTGPFYGATPGPAFASFDRGLRPGQGKITPWTMKSSSQFRAADFYDPVSPEFAEQFDTICHLGAADSTMRTADQSQIALFWEDGPWGITPPGHFLYIAMQLLQDRGLSFIELARAFALIGMTQCDASICAWDNKYHYDILRPETAIRARAPQLGNPDPRVKRHPRWRSYIPTPEFPAYTSGHSTFGAAAAEMIALIHGRDDVAFSGRSPDEVLWPQLRGVTRHWSSLSHMAEENGMSRIYGGVHWLLDNTEAMKAGRAIARQAFHTTFPQKA